MPRSKFKGVKHKVARQLELIRKQQELDALIAFSTDDDQIEQPHRCRSPERSPEEGATEIIPTDCILKELEIKWPSNTSSNVATKCIKEREPASKDCETEKIKIYTFSKDKTDMAQETLDSDSDSSEHANIPGRSRRRKKPVQYEEFSDDSDDSPSESESVVKKPKQYRIPSLPTALTLSTKNNVQIMGEMKENVSGSSESLSGKESNATSESHTAVFNQLIKYMKLMHGELKELNATSESINSKLNRLISLPGEHTIPSDWCLPSGINLPADTDEELQKLNENLKNDKELSSALVRYLYSSASGRTVSLFVLSITKKVLSQEVALMYNRYGRNGKKSFSNLPETLNVILAASALKFKDANRDDLLAMFGKALAGAPDWNGRKPRPSDHLLNSPIFN